MINSKLIEDAVYNLCVEANTTLNDDVFAKLQTAYDNEENNDAKSALLLILKNAKLAYENKMPLCQDTGQVLVFVRGSSKFIPDNIKELINNGVEKAYKENFYRQSVVKNAVFDRTNTKTNTPCVIYTEITDSEGLEIELLIKGGGSENVSVASMLSPTSSESDIIDFVVSAVEKAGAKGCPPYFIGVGIGGTIDYAGLLSKKALLLEDNIDENHKKLAQNIKNSVNDLKIGVAGYGGSSTAVDVKILTDFTHIACMPVAVTMNCHSSRHSKCTISEQGEVKSEQNTAVKNYKPEDEDFSDFVRVNTSDVSKLKSLKSGQKVLLSGEIYSARDMAHKRLLEMLANSEKLPFDLKDKIIFYAGPCPSRPSNPACTDCVVGSIGPTTSARMDKFAPTLYQKGVLATIGKGSRSEEVKTSIKKTGGIYFTVIGGIACYLSKKFVKKELIAFEDLGTEAICRFEVKDLPLRVELA